MPPRKKKTTRRRKKAKNSLIDMGVALVGLNATTMMLFDTNAYNFATDGWFGRKPSASTDNSWELSLHEIVTTLIDPSKNFGVHAVSAGHFPDFMSIVKRNFKRNGAAAIGTIIAAPILATMIKRVARKQINQANKMLDMTGVPQALNVKV